MLEVVFKFSDREDAHKLNYEFCSIFQGLKAFKEDDIIVTPVDFFNEDDKPMRWKFSIIFPDNDVNKTIEFDSGEIDIMNLKKAWVFSKVVNK